MDAQSAPTLGMRSSDGKPGAVHQEFWDAVEQMVRGIVEENTATLGTVVGKDGGMVRVQVDDEDDAREVGIPRKRGERYDVGDRVKLQPLRGGSLIADGTISTKDGIDPAVGNEDLHTDSVDKRAIKQNEVTNDAIAPGAVNNESIRGTDVDTRIGTAQTTASAGLTAVGALDSRIYQGQGSLQGKMDDTRNKVFGGGGYGGGLQGDVQDIKGDINGNGGIKSDITNLKSDVGAAKTDANKANDAINPIQSDIKKIKDRLNKIESRI